MKKPAFATAAVLLALALSTTAHAAGTNLSWDDCGVFGLEQKTFACNTNVGANVLYGSAIAPQAMPQLNGQSTVLTLVTDQSTLSNWWQLGTGGCRGTAPAAISANFDFTQNANCLDPWIGQAQGGVLYLAGFNAPNRAEIRTDCAVAGSTAIDAEHEYYFFKVTITNARAVGNGSCAGCSDGACILLSSLQLTQLSGAGDATLDADHPITRNWVRWQAGAVTGGCPAALPAKSPTWGLLKSLYR